MPFRFNNKDLGVTALQSSSLFVKEGILWFKEKESKRFNKVENFTERFVRLRGNLLFYFKNKEKNSECSGVIVLERYNVVEDTSYSIYGFTIEFDEPEEQKYEFGATSKADLDEWLCFLKSASYEKLHKTMVELRHEILSKTGQDPLPDYHPRLGYKATDMDNQKENLFVPSDNQDDNIIMEMCIACANLAPGSETAPATMVRLFTMEPPSIEWVKHSQTEVCEESREPNFFKTLTLTSKFQPITRLKFVVFDVISKSKNDVVAIGSAVCTIQEIQQAKNCQTTLSIMNMDIPSGVIKIQGWMRENGCYTGTMSENLKDELFERPKTGNDLKFQEFLAESLLCFKIPCMLLNLFISEEKESVLELHGIGQLHSEWEKIKEHVVQYNHFDLVQRYSISLADLCQFEDVNFKRSLDKGRKELEFIPTNLHIHRLCVTEDNAKEFFYDVVTVGAPTAHSLKYKSGGLRRMIENTDENTRKILEGFGQDEKRKANYLKAVHAKDVLRRLKIDIMSQINLLKIIIETKSDDLSKFKSCINMLSSKIGELLGLNSTLFVQDSMAQLLRARTNGPELRIKSMTISTNIDNISLSEIKWEWSGTEFKPVNKSYAALDDNKVCETLGKFVSAINSGISSEINASCGQLDTITSFVLSLINRINVIMRFIQMQDEAQSTGLVEFRYRRDIVFSQTLTSVVAGFVVLLSQQINNTQFLDQLLKVGLLIHFESLLTTYGDEMGMIEDMYIGVTDLKEVKFKIICSDSSSFPSISGNRSSIVVEIPFKSKQFKLLPKDIQDGCTISLYPVMFSIGINESATLAEKFGDTSLQEDINSNSCISLQTYYHSFNRWYPDYVRSRSATRVSLETLLNNLLLLSTLKKSKNYEVLLVSEELCWRMNGLRLTCCKSAKDRTSMSVTLEMVKTLEREHDMNENVFNKVLNSVRSQGVRLINSYKNVGLPKYAFNKVQVKALPLVYRPPEGTIGKFYWLQERDANERNVLVQNNVRIYDGDEMTTFDNGELTLTNLKLIWKDSLQKERVLALDLTLVQKIDSESGSLFKSPKVLVYLNSSLKNKPAGPKQKSQHNYVKLSFRSGGNEQFIKAFKNVLSSKDWEILNAAIEKPKEPVEISHRHVGIVGIERKIQEKYDKTDENVAQAFKDLDVLIEKAKDMVMIADKFSKKLQEKEISITDDETTAFKSYLLSMGIENPVTRETHGSGVRYHVELAKQLASFLQNIIEDSGGVMTLSDVFCRFNRARGMELVSPEDLVNAAKMMESLKTNMKLHKFESGVLVIQSMSHTEEEIIVSAANKVKDVGSLTSEEFARLIGIALTLAKERLLLAEKAGYLCRDDSVEGLRFFPNRKALDEVHQVFT